MWITSLNIRAKQICSRNYFNQEISLIKDYTVWNGFLKRIANSIIKRASQSNDSNTTRSKKANADSIKIFFNLNYPGETAERRSNHASKKCKHGNIQTEIRLYDLLNPISQIYYHLITSNKILKQIYCLLSK